MIVQRGDIFDADLPTAGSRPVVVVTRNEAIPVLTSVTVVPVTGTIRGHRAELPLGTKDGLSKECVANCDTLMTVSKKRLSKFRGHLDGDAVFELGQRIVFALDLS